MVLLAGGLYWGAGSLGWGALQVERASIRTPLLLPTLVRTSAACTCFHWGPLVCEEVHARSSRKPQQTVTQMRSYMLDMRGVSPPTDFRSTQPCRSSGQRAINIIFKLEYRSASTCRDHCDLISTLSCQFFKQGAPAGRSPLAHETINKDKDNVYRQQAQLDCRINVAFKCNMRVRTDLF